MSETYSEQEENTLAEVQPLISGEDEVHTKETDSSPHEKGEKPVVSQRSDEKDKPETSAAIVTKPKEDKEATGKRVAKQPARKLRCYDPSETVGIAIGTSGVAAAKPVTVPSYFQSTCDRLPNGVALCWKDRKEDPWKTLTYAQYRRQIYYVAKSFLKVMLYSEIAFVCYVVMI